MQLSVLSILSLFVAIADGSSNGLHISPASTGGFLKTNKENEINVSGLGDGTNFYNEASLKVQLEPDGSIYSFLNDHFDASNVQRFAGKTEDGMSRINVMRYFNGDDDDEGILTGVVHDMEKHLWYELRNDSEGNSYVNVIASKDIPGSFDWDGIMNSMSYGLRSPWQLMNWFNNNEEIDTTSTVPAVSVMSENEIQKLPITNTVINIAVLWTKNAECNRSGMGRFWCFPNAKSRKNMEADVLLMIQESNDAFTNSGIALTLDLVHSKREESGYTENWVFFPLIVSLQALMSDRDSYMDEVHDLKKEKDVNTVLLLMEGNDNWIYCGAAFLNANTEELRERGFAVSQSSCMFTLTPVHEVGHSLGCNHDRGTADKCDSLKTNYGYRDPAGDFSTVMSFDCRTGQCDDQDSSSCDRIPYFSGDYTYTTGASLGGTENNCKDTIISNMDTVANNCVGGECAKNDLCQFLIFPMRCLFGFLFPWFD